MHAGLSCDLMMFVYCINIPVETERNVYGDFSLLFFAAEAASLSSFLFKLRSSDII